ncbi:MAG: sigma factor-like helix-turn-helix DNA-binding protein [Candidatus Pacebacteria bacterium]|nr:sigma factor-like helix-turn-helix DNA-binding protein [Candidatus Paceibacterota bacterium]
MKTKLNYTKICSDIFSSLPDRPQEVIKRRFGLDLAGKRQTLQHIGKSLGITRERVRQIESDAICTLRAYCFRSADLRSVFAYFDDYLKKYGGLRREDSLLSDLGCGAKRNLIFFLLFLGQDLHRFEQNSDFHSFWARTKDFCEQAEDSSDYLIKKLKENKAPISREEVYVLLNERPRIFVDSLLEVSRAFDISPLGSVGLTAWPEIKPKGARDAAYIILKKLGRPLHFKEIADNANAMASLFFQKKNILPQTVHNELIRDPKFILVGRGIYGLKEWGYSEGTVKDVICGILKNNDAALTRQEIIQRVLQQRIVQPNTVFLNLNDKARFKKDEQGKYTLKEV